MISRVADHCFWLGRYLERTESTARMLFVTANLALDTELAPSDIWRPVIIVSGEEERFLERFDAEATGDGEAVQDYLTWDATCGASLLSSIDAARWNARAIREVISLEVWESVNELHLWLRTDAARTLWSEGRYDFYRHIKRQVQLVLGQVHGTMLHNHAMDFIWLGLLLERTGQTARTLDVHHHVLSQLEARSADLSVELVLLPSLLRACSALEPFMKSSGGVVRGPRVAEFLLLEREFPRSVRFCVRRALDCLSRIRPLAATKLPGGETLERMRALDAWLQDISAETISRDGFHDILTHVVDETACICTGLGHEVLGHGDAAQA
ncbi:MAG: alpha-E domain-containing protein [Deltaproteobacteria bacterium]|nr:alpha-E domain-containing protein [Deltaproteobacteria bacterium]